MRKKNLKKPKMTRGKKIAARARRDSFIYGTKKEVYAYPTGKRKATYMNDLNRVYPENKSWSRQRSRGAACDVFVGTVVRASGVDKNFPPSILEIEDYCKKHKKKWKKMLVTNKEKMRQGDIIFQFFKSGGRHVSIYLGKGKVANAHAVAQTYSVVESYSKVIKPKKDCTKFWIYRAREKKRKTVKPHRDGAFLLQEIKK